MRSQTTIRSLSGGESRIITLDGDTVTETGAYRSSVTFATTSQAAEAYWRALAQTQQSGTGNWDVPVRYEEGPGVIATLIDDGGRSVKEIVRDAGGSIMNSAPRPIKSLPV